MLTADDPSPEQRCQTWPTDRIRGVLSDPHAGLSTAARHRYEGALTALEAVLGEAPSLILDEPERFLL
ncbi:MAG TPA: hypothetical protein VGL48_13835 [Acidimicrobiales bacterium]|jgi:hypothetical protein